MPLPHNTVGGMCTVGSKAAEHTRLFQMCNFFTWVSSFNARVADYAMKEASLCSCSVPVSIHVFLATRVSEYLRHMVPCENICYRQHIPKAFAVGVLAGNITDFCC